MPRHKTRKREVVSKTVAPRPAGRRWLWPALAIVVASGAIVTALLATRGAGRSGAGVPAAPMAAVAPKATPAPAAHPAPPPAQPAGPAPDTAVMEVAKAVMVTVELDFGPRVPSIAEALREIERRYAPDDGKGRTFAILDAYGEPTADGKLHVSMHVSSEKPGTGSLVFRRTGEVLWTSRIVPGSSEAGAPKNLGIIVDDGRGTGRVVDGSGNPASILDAIVRDLSVPVREFWPDGQEREVTFIYSACGCPVKVMARRAGERTVRTKELPVIFPDDPAAAAAIARLMRW
jgi:hypothetical protein